MALISTCRVWGAEASPCGFAATFLKSQLLAPAPPGQLTELGGEPGFKPIAPQAQPRILATLLSVAQEAFLLVTDVLQAEAVPGMSFPVTAHRAAGLTLVEAVPELATGPGQVPAHLGEQDPQLGRIRRQLRSVESRGIGHQGSWSQGKQFHMAGRVPTTPQPTRHSPHLQLQFGTQTVEQTALAHT